VSPQHNSTAFDSPPGESDRSSLLQHEEETKLMIKELMTRHRDELSLFDREWIYNHSDIANDASQSFLVRGPESRLKIRRSAAAVDRRYQEARVRIARRQQTEIAPLFNER
jgi:hypothetical protein